MNIKRFGQGNKLLWKDRKRWAGLPLSFTRYFLIEKPDQWVKFFTSIGLFNTTDEELYLFRVFDITVEQTFMNKIFNEGTIILHVNDESANKIEIKRVLNPFKVKEMISDYVEFERRRRGMAVAEFHS
ncbi:MAG: PH domain-containing protein [Clostridia bacterium]|nr:PH domain-containing protein [Clostridia bacterium]